MTLQMRLGVRSARPEGRALFRACTPSGGPGAGPNGRGRPGVGFAVHEPAYRPQARL